MYVYMYICIYVYVCMCMYIHVYCRWRRETFPTSAGLKAGLSEAKDIVPPPPQLLAAALPPLPQLLLVPECLKVCRSGTLLVPEGLGNCWSLKVYGLSL